MKIFFKSKKVLAILLIILSIIAEITLAVIFWNKSDKQSNFIEILCFSTQIISSIFVTSGVIIAVWQYYLSSQSTKKNLEIIQIQRAIDLSQYYKDNILKFVPAITYVFEKVKILEIFDRIKIDDMRDFDTYELERLLTKDQIRQLKSVQNSDAFVKAILEANDIYGLNLQFMSFETIIEKDGQKGKSLKLDKNSIIIAFMANLLNATLNNLEFFALHFKHNTADESVIYQSLHQTYLKNIPYLYYFIARHNTDPANKLYTNVIWLFNEWKQKKLSKTFCVHKVPPRYRPREKSFQRNIYKIS